MAEEGQALAVRRPPRQVGQHRRKNELKLLRAIDLAAPHGAVGGVVIGDPLTIAGKIKAHRRDSREVRNKMLCFAVVTQQFAAGTPTLHENFLAVPAGNWVANVHGAGGQLGRFARSGAEEYAAFVQGPEIRGIVALRLKKEKLSVSSPFSAAFVGSRIPSAK